MICKLCHIRRSILVLKHKCEFFVSPLHLCIVPKLAQSRSLVGKQVKLKEGQGRKEEGGKG